MPVKTFTVGYDIGTCNEIEPARRVANIIGTSHQELILTQDDVRERAPVLLAALDQPIADQAIIASHALAEGARPHVTVAVGGEGADELFGGYPRYRWLGRSSRLHRLLPATALRVARAAVDRVSIPGRAARLCEIFDPGPMISRHLGWVTNRRDVLSEQIYGARLRPRLASRDSWLKMSALLEPGLDGEIADIMRLDQTMWLPDDVLTKADRASMLVSLEVRAPFLERRLAEFASTIPPAVHCRGKGKALLRAALRRVLPELPATRPKTAFRVPAAEWLRGPLAAPLSDQLRAGRLYADGWFDRGAVARLVDQHQRRAHDWTSVLWPVLSLGLWMDHFLGES
jgi:asparagine synthase (glutamine-hydrolysing)